MKKLILKLPILLRGTACSSNSLVQVHKQSSQSPDNAPVPQVKHLPHEISVQLKKDENKICTFNSVP